MSARPEASHSHADAMNNMYRLQRHIYDASRYFYLLGRDTLLERLTVPEGGSVLEIGCGTGRNLIAAAKLYPTARLFGIDISEEMLKSALLSSKRSGLHSKIIFACVDATQFNSLLSLGESRFDRIMFSYSLSMIPNWRGALLHAASLLKENGQLHIADFGQCERLPSPCRAILHRWLDWFHVTPRRALRQELESLAGRFHRSATFQSRFRGYTWLAAIQPLEPAPLQERASRPLMQGL